MIQKILERIRRLSRQERVILVAASLAVLILAIDRLVIAPVRGYLETVTEKIELRKREILKNERNVALKPDMTPLYEKMISPVKMTGTDDHRIAEMLGEIGKFGSESEVTFSNIKPARPKTVDFYRVLPGELQAECSMKKFLTFLHKLQGSPHLFRIESFKMRSQQQDPDLLQVNMTFSRLDFEEVPAHAGK